MFLVEENEVCQPNVWNIMCKHIYIKEISWWTINVAYLRNWGMPTWCLKHHDETSRPNIYVFKGNLMMDNKCYVVKRKRYTHLMRTKEISCWKMRYANVMFETSRPNIYILKKNLMMDNKSCMLKRMRYANLMEKWNFMLENRRTMF